MRPNYKTSEFWFTVVTFIFSGLFLLGVLTDYDQKEELIGDVAHGVESVFLIGGQLAVLYKYINSRKTEKVEYQRRKRKEAENLEEELEETISINDDIININTANIVDLIRLPGIGPSTAKNILEYRKQNGDFDTTKDLLNVNGIGKSVYNDIHKNITV
jgi:competence ComEA-like helix-hairpin-helix protein